MRIDASGFDPGVEWKPTLLHWLHQCHGAVVIAAALWPFTFVAVCTTCDGFACAVSAKNDLATVVVQPLVKQGLHLRPNTVVTRLVATLGPAAAA